MMRMKVSTQKGIEEEAENKHKWNVQNGFFVGFLKSIFWISLPLLYFLFVSLSIPFRIWKKSTNYLVRLGQTIRSSATYLRYDYLLSNPKVWNWIKYKQCVFFGNFCTKRKKQKYSGLWILNTHQRRWRYIRQIFINAFAELKIETCDLINNTNTFST